MDHDFIHHKTFDKTDFIQQPLPLCEYDHCTFTHCNFSGASLAGINFTSCKFIGCNLSLVRLTKTAFNDVLFHDCKMMGIHFEHCNQFVLNIRIFDCILDHSSFYRSKLKKTIFTDSRLHETDFTEADLGSAVFDNCDLAKATFDQTMLENADFRTAFNYSIDPTINRIRKARFSQSGIAGLLNKFDIDISYE